MNRHRQHVRAVPQERGIRIEGEFLLSVPRIRAGSTGVEGHRSGRHVAASDLSSVEIDHGTVVPVQAQSQSPDIRRLRQSEGTAEVRRRIRRADVSRDGLLGAEVARAAQPRRIVVVHAGPRRAQVGAGVVVAPRRTGRQHVARSHGLGRECAEAVRLHEHCRVLAGVLRVRHHQLDGVLYPRSHRCDTGERLGETVERGLRRGAQDVGVLDEQVRIGVGVDRRRRHQVARARHDGAVGAVDEDRHRVCYVASATCPVVLLRAHQEAQADPVACGDELGDEPGRVVRGLGSDRCVEIGVAGGMEFRTDGAVVHSVQIRDLAGAHDEPGRGAQRGNPAVGPPRLLVTEHLEVRDPDPGPDQPAAQSLQLVLRNQLVGGPDDHVRVDRELRRTRGCLVHHIDNGGVRHGCGVVVQLWRIALLGEQHEEIALARAQRVGAVCGCGGPRHRNQPVADVAEAGDGHVGERLSASPHGALDLCRGPEVDIGHIVGPDFGRCALVGRVVEVAVRPDLAALAPVDQSVLRR